jgi:hypothetical protein
MQVKGQAEDAVIEREFPHTVILRPGMLDRGDKQRTGEKLIKVLSWHCGDCLFIFCLFLNLVGIADDQN